MQQAIQEPQAVVDTPEQRQHLIDLANTRMPFGKYAGRLLLDLPEPYLAWFARTGFPRGKLGGLLRTAFEVKTNGLERLVRPLHTSG